MKKIFALLMVIGLLAFTSCTEEEVTTSDITPANLTISATDDGTGVILTWEPPISEIDGYIIYFNGYVLDTVPPTFNEYTHLNVTDVGTYELRAFKGDVLSDPLTASTEPKVTSVQLTLAELNAAGNSGLGFLSDWTATTYPMADSSAPDNVDFYFTDGSPGSTGILQYLASADEVVDTSFEDGYFTGIPSTGWRENFITRGAPEGGIIEDNTIGDTKYDVAVTNTSYVFKVVRGNAYYYGTIQLGSVTNTQCVVVTVKVQTIPNLRIIGD